MIESPNLIISVESRKGGVGKTTAALCLGRLLVEHGYSVLLIDVDVTGTNAGDVGNSPYWTNHLHIVKIQGERDKANVLDLFDKKFMPGLRLPSFTLSNERPTGEQGLTIDVDKVNVLGSQIYDNSDSCICTPSLLFDQLHAYWMLDFLKTIIADFTRIAVQAGNNRPIAVILDNSPGYVGIAPMIQEWLTDIGPNIGKFLMVTSLDTQDMTACAMALNVLHKTLCKKMDTADQYHKALDSEVNDGTNLSVEREQYDFFIRLADTQKSDAENVESPSGMSLKELELEFYRRLKTSKNRTAEDCSPQRYLAAIVNRVPKAVFQGRRPYQLLEADKPTETKILLELLGGKTSREWKKRMIPYDEYVEFQFLQSGLSKTSYRKSRWLTRLMSVFENSTHRLRYLSERYSLRKLQLDESSTIMLNKGLNIAQATIDECLQALMAANLDHLASLIQPDWQPASIVVNFRIALRKFAADHDFIEEEFTDQLLRVEREELTMMRELHARLLDNVRDFELLSATVVVDDLVTSLVYLVVWSLPAGWRHSIPMEVTADIFSNILSTELSHWVRLRKGKRGRDTIQGFLAAERYNMEYDSASFHKDFFPVSNGPDRQGFAELYKACTYAQARLLDMWADTAFLVGLMSSMLEYEVKHPTALPYVRDVAESVILQKTELHDYAYENMQKELADSKYHDAFLSTVAKVLVEWGIAK